MLEPKFPALPGYANVKASLWQQLDKQQSFVSTKTKQLAITEMPSGRTVGVGDWQPSLMNKIIICNPI